MALPGAQALSLQKRDEPAVFSFPVQRRRDTNLGRLQERAATASSPLGIQNSEYPAFFCNISLGTPPQQVEAQLDTGSSYLFVIASNSSACTETSSDSEKCLTPGSFNISASSTYTATGSQINETYTTGTMLTGVLGTDTLTLGSATMNMELAVQYDLEAINILGLGYSSNNSSTSLPQALVKSGQINSAAYSLWADDPSGDSGTLLLGGVNSAKYTGELYTTSIPAAADGVHHLPMVLVSNVVVQSNSSTSAKSDISGLPAYMILDSNVFWTYLPDDVVENIYRDLNVSFSRNGQIGEITDCSVGYQNYNVTFSFSNFDINIPLSFFLTENDDGNSCAFTIVPSGDEAAILGANFLRSVYTVYDLPNNEISLAQRDFTKSSPDNILEINNSSTIAIPGAVSISVSVATTVTVPTAATIPSPITTFPPALSTEASRVTSTTAAKNAAPTLSSVANKLTAGLMGAFICFAL
ncbi:uncharacterized protein BHQ10_007258 [Talaromyces amestolkiae]|uniref:Peptidase A1 domain-containing protein n=1 Tax=Talaromyces amestolkiae TaxID=1196081 RepID=A0A364L626_TALAM|nr:uncharacterized protein BHQ10_007258 [Talaromyces amestolkiae]RAO71246.1 hypothetical protein BHQ10_007258 [Talaromyces amestolkiae]